jgi:flagellar hook-associated protein 1 FlgK
LPASDGTVGIFLAGSQALVQGSTANPLAISASAYPGDSGTATLTIQQGGLSMPMDESNLGGGSVKGLLSFMNKDLMLGRNLVGRMALAIGTVVNDQHKLGLDMHGNVGGDLFQLAAMPNGLPATSNAGTSTLSMSVSDPTALAASNYEVRYSSGTAGTVTRLSDGQTTAFDFATPPVQVDGLTLSTTAGAVAGDRFLLKPFSAVASTMDTAFTSPQNLAVASQIQAGAGNLNAGGLAVASLQSQTANVNLTQPVTLTFNAAAGTFDVSGTGTGNPVNVPYTPGQPISYNGWSLTLSGLPKTGDTITVSAANPAYAATNAGNATSLVNLRDKALFDGATLTDGYAGVIAQVGVLAQTAGFAASTSQAISTNAQTALASVSGVNMDEEAAKLLQFQQSYQASAKVMQVAQSLFGTLISAFGG